MDGDKKRSLAERVYNANVLTDASLKSADLIDVVIENIKENGVRNQIGENDSGTNDGIAENNDITLKEEAKEDEEY